MASASVMTVRTAIRCLLLRIVLAQLDCGERGTYHSETDSCDCKNSRPVNGTSGSTGQTCDVDVTGGILDGEDMTRSCAKEATECAFLKPNSWSCFYARLPETWNHLTTELRRVSDDGDPDLYGLFDNGSPTRYPSGAETDYDFEETSSGTHPRVSVSVSHAEAVLAAGTNITGVWLCVKAYGKRSINISLRGIVTDCPAVYTESGIEQCSSPGTSPGPGARYEACTPQGECLCTGPYRRPTASTYPGLGFEQCSAMVVRVDDASFREDNGKRVELKKQASRPGEWTFYEFNVTQDDFQVEVALDEEQVSQHGEPADVEDTGFLSMFAKFGAPPSSSYHEWDFSTGWGFAYDYFEGDKLSFNADNDNYRQGTWFVGVYGEQHAAVTYTLTIDKYACPMNCNGHGRCHHFECICDEGYAGKDCSTDHAVLKFEQPVEEAPSFFEYEYFTLPSFDAALANRSITLDVEVSYHKQSLEQPLGFEEAGFEVGVLDKPELLLIRADNPNDMPSLRNYTFKHLLAEENKSYHATLTATEASQGVWHAALYYPGRIWRVGYKIVVHRLVMCPGNADGQCSGKGACNDEAQCECQSPWSGADCSVRPGGSCELGSMKREHRPDAHGTCWQPCRCNGGACEYDGTTCELFTCDATADGRTPFRHVQSQYKCVEDACTQDTWHDVTNGVCHQKCVCPADGSACQLQSGCQTLLCDMGFVADLNARQPGCVPENCSNSRMQEVNVESSSNAVKAFATCHCTGTECKLQGAAQNLLLYCKPGYVQKGGNWDNGVAAQLGGVCVRAPSTGSPAWGVALGVVLALAVGAGLGILGYWYYQWRQNMGVNAGIKELYQELSVNTGGSGF